jgi:hypothetical protein
MLLLYAFSFIQVISSQTENTTWIGMCTDHHQQSICETQSLDEYRMLSWKFLSFYSVMYGFLCMHTYIQHLA